MVQLWNLDISNLYLGAGAGGLVLIFLLWWFLFRSPGGRLGEEEAEEIETRQLELDEKREEYAQKDEKKQCEDIKKIVHIILQQLQKTGEGEVYDKVIQSSAIIIAMLNRLRDEKMNLDRAKQTFISLHGSLNEFIGHLPQNRRMKRLIAQIIYYQNRYYKDLVKEAKIDGDKKRLLKELWAQVNDEEKGRGQLQAA